MSRQNFFKQFLSGIFIVIVMTGLDQDMMQKNLSCRSLRDAQKNMYCYGFAFAPLNLLFLGLGILLLVLAQEMQLELPAAGDDILPLFATQGYLGEGVLILFTIGIIAAAFSNSDSALTAMTTSFCIDLLDTGKDTEEEARRKRNRVHIGLSVLLIFFICLVDALNNQSVIDAIYIIASYTYGPLLGMFAFGLFTQRKTNDRWVPFIAIASPLICYAADRFARQETGYQFGYELLINMLTGRKGLAMTSATPGKTMLINHFLINNSWYLVDLPGYGYARRGQKGQEQIRTIIEDYILEREQMTNLFVLIDSRLEPQKIDLEFMEWLGENGIPFAIIFTKADKLKGGRLKINISAYLRELRKQWEELPPYFITSSEERLGRTEVLNYIESINKQLNSK